MNIYLGQFYIEAGASFPFSLFFQKWFGKNLTEFSNGWGINIEKYPEDFDLIFRISSKTKINEIEIKGPSIFKKDKNVEFTIFIPYRKIEQGDIDGIKVVCRSLIHAIELVFLEIGISPSILRSRSQEMIDAIVNNPDMFKS